MGAKIISQETKEERKNRKYKTKPAYIDMSVIDTILKSKNLKEITENTKIMDIISQDPGYYMVAIADHFNLANVTLEYNGKQFSGYAPPPEFGSIINIIYRSSIGSSFDAVPININPIWKKKSDLDEIEEKKQQEIIKQNHPDDMRAK